MTDDAANDVGRLSRLKRIAEHGNGGQRTSTLFYGNLAGWSWNREPTRRELGFGVAV